MSPRAWIRRGAAAVAASAALLMAFQPAADASHWWQDRPDGKHSQYKKRWKHGNDWRTRARWTPPAPETNQAPQNNAEPAASPADSGNQAPSGGGDIADQIVALTNAERSKAGLPPLERNDCLATTAQNWSGTMDSQQRMFHSDLRSWMDRCSLNSAGENVAHGQRSAEEVVRAWMTSAGHRKNILNPGYRYIGVGKAGTHYTQTFGA